jgi:hypothetical protein
MCSLGWQAAGPTRILANHRLGLRVHAGPPQQGDDNHYAGPLPKWCGHHHAKGPLSTAAQRFPDKFIDALLEGIAKEVVRAKATKGEGETAIATLSPDGDTDDRVRPPPPRTPRRSLKIHVLISRWR